MSSRSKGSKAERSVAGLLKRWTKKDFARTPSSGGLQWKSSMSKGDVVCTTEGHYFPFCVEVKFHREINFSHLLYSVDSNIMEFWGQCVRDAFLAGKVPMLLMRYNRLPKDFYFLAIPHDFWVKLPMLERSTTITKSMVYKNRTKTLPPMVIVSSFEFFKLDYKAIKIIAKNECKKRKK